MTRHTVKILTVIVFVLIISILLVGLFTTKKIMILNIVSNFTSKVYRSMQKAAKIMLPKSFEACRNVCTLMQVIECYFKPKNIKFIGKYVFRNVNVEELNKTTKIWLTLSWVSTNIRYNYTKAMLQTFCVQTPYETIKLGSGVCIDYAVLIASLLLYLNVSPVYIVIFHNINHAVVIVQVHGYPFVLDQKLPPIELQDYVQYLIGSSSLNNVTVYKLYVRNGEIHVDILHTLPFKLVDDYPMDNVSPLLVHLVNLKLEKLTNRKIDESLQLLAEAELYTVYLRRYIGVYVGGKMVRVSIFKLYDPIFREEWAGWIASMLVNAVTNNRYCKYFYVSINSSTVALTCYVQPVKRMYAFSIGTYAYFIVKNSCNVDLVIIYRYGYYKRPLVAIVRPQYFTREVPYIIGHWSCVGNDCTVRVNKYTLCNYLEQTKRYVILGFRNGKIVSIGFLSNSEICS